MQGINIYETLMRGININEFYMGININQMIEYYYTFQNTKELEG